MSDSGTPKRPNLRVGRLRTRPPPRDPRTDSVHPRGEAPARRLASRPGVAALPARLANLETELARLKEERGADTDEVAEMLVRVAAAERTVEAATHRAIAAERSSRESAATLERTLEELADAKRSLDDFEATLARARRDHDEAIDQTRREHSAKVEALERKHADELGQQGQADAGAVREAARVLELERSAAARARQQAAAAEEALGVARKVMAQAASLVEDIERREETATAIRARALDQTKRLLASPPGSETSPRSAEASESAALPAKTAARPRKPSMRPTEPATVEMVTFEDLDLDLPD